jgi:hypothetical protein
MTSERRIIARLTDIKLLSYECKKCGARVSFSPDSGPDAGDHCFQCNAEWYKPATSIEARPPAYLTARGNRPYFD